MGSIDNGPDQQQQLKMFFLPFIGPGHMIPMVDIARLFAATSPTIDVTIITTAHNALLFKSSIDKDTESGYNIKLKIFQFPSAQVGLPEGIENFNSITSPDMSSKLYQGIMSLQNPIERFLRESNPDCIVSDMFYTWTVDLAKELNCPRLVFQGTSFFVLSVVSSIRSNKPHESVTSDTEKFLIPGFPDRIEMTRSQLPDHVKNKKNPYGAMVDAMKEAEKRSYGIVMNSFYELEPVYADYYRNALGRKVWHIGPVSDRISREIKVENHDCLNWLDSKKPSSVLYVCFGSMKRFPKAQLVELASGLEASRHPFIWVVREQKKTANNEDDDEEEQWLTKDYENGMIIKGWAPQVAILSHPATGGFVTHCGWNSVLESVSAGVPMIAWPLMAEQFYNEKLITQVLKIGVGIGVGEWNNLMDDAKTIVGRERIEKAVTLLMDNGNKEAEEIRKKAKEIGKMAKKAVEEGGSSYSSLNGLIEELKLVKMSKVA